MATAPSITSNGGGDVANIVVPENMLAITTVTAFDPDPNTQLTYSFVGGPDQSRMTINGATGALAFFGPIYTNFEQPFYSAGNNFYSVQVRVSDGALTDTQTVNVTLADVNEAPIISGGTLRSVAVRENGTDVTRISASDPDDGAILTYAIVGGSDAASFNLNSATGLLTFKTAPNFESPSDANHDNGYVVQVRVSDGTLAADQTIIANIDNVNEAPVIISNGGLTSPNVSVPENTTFVTKVEAVDQDSNSSITYRIEGGSSTFKIDPISGILQFINAPDYETGSHFFSATLVASDGAQSSSFQFLTINVTNVVEASDTPTLNGTSGNDSFSVSSGDKNINGRGGHDTVSFSFNLTDSNISFSDNKVIVDTATSHTVIIGVEEFRFFDGVINNDDGNPLVDDLYYYSQNHDVWTAHADADVHYGTSGWREGRNPDAFFDSNLYLAINQDVRAAGVNPLTHFEQSGWKEGRQPSLSFNDNQYLTDNPDVAAAHVNPLSHFLQSGEQEGRHATAVSEIFAANGFDYAYYLQHNPDVAAARVDPYQHFEAIGWKEHRNPNAMFDTAGYLNAYPDVAAAGVNPLDHYHQSGWQEGRDPSGTFDTASYLLHNPDVAAAHIDPLLHFLQNGIHEGRAVFSDGVFA